MSLQSSASHRGFVVSAEKSATTTTTSQGTPIVPRTTSVPFGTMTSLEKNMVVSKEYDVYLVVTPFENTIGRAVAEELAKQLLLLAVPSTTNHPDATKTSVICLVRRPPVPSSNETKNIANDNSIFFSLQLFQWLRKLRNTCFRYIMNIESIKTCEEQEIDRWVDTFSTTASPILVLSSGKGASRTMVNDDFGFDPFGGTSSIRDSSEQCLNGIRMQLFQRMAEEALSSSENRTDSGISSSNITTTGNNINHDDGHDDGGDLLSTTIHIRGILFNPYGCPPTPPTMDAKRSNNPNQNQTLRFSPLAEYKLLSIAVFVDVALATRTTILTLPMCEFLRERENKGETNHHFTPKQSTTSGAEPASSLPPLRIVVVGTEAARGLPKMGIPVPDLEGATESSIRDKLHNEGGSHWESDYAEMNALAVLYFKAMESSMAITPQNPTAVAGGSTTGSYFGILSPGMTPESFKIVHVPEPARTMAFRWKLWLCNRRWVFGWLQRLEIAKTTEQAGGLLVNALMNGPMYDTESENANANADPKSKSAGVEQQDRLRRWDDIYPSGSFVGARSGTGGPLCEQSLLVYDATSDRVGPGPAQVVENVLSGGPSVAVSASAVIKDESSSSDDQESPTSTFNDRNHERTNFLGNRRLQALVYRVVRGIIGNSTS
jgi:hypothetical protein